MAIIKFGIGGQIISVSDGEEVEARETTDVCVDAQLCDKCGMQHVGSDCGVATGSN